MTMQFRDLLSYAVSIRLKRLPASVIGTPADETDAGSTRGGNHIERCDRSDFVKNCS